MKDEKQKQFLSLLKSVGMELPVPEFIFHPTRKWRFDFAWPDHYIALEVEGGIFIGGRHSRGVGMQQDFTKYNEAAILGWRIIKVVPKELISSQTIKLLQKLI